MNERTLFSYSLTNHKCEIPNTHLISSVSFPQRIDLLQSQNKSMMLP